MLLRAIERRLYDAVEEDSPEDAAIRDLLHEQVKRDCTQALRRAATNFKAHYRRALACLELGELDQALEDANKVLAHYETTETQNPEASVLKERVLEAVKNERRKWVGEATKMGSRGGFSLSPRGYVQGGLGD